MRTLLAMLLLAAVVVWLWLAFADADMGSVKAMVDRYIGP